MFHGYTRKHGDMETGLQFLRAFSDLIFHKERQLPDVNQNRRSETLLHPAVGAANIERSLTSSRWTDLIRSSFSTKSFAWRENSFVPGELYEHLLNSRARAKSL